MNNISLSNTSMNSLRRDHFGRYVCCLFAQPSQREWLVQFFIWVEEMDEIKYKVSEPMLGHIRIQWWREAIDATYQGNSPDHPFLAMLAKQKKIGTLPQAAFETFLSACEQEMDGFVPDNLAELEQFIANKYSSILALAAALLGNFEQSTQQAIHHMALAYGHLDLLLKAPMMARKQCIMLPRDLLTEAEINADEAPLAENKRIVKEITLFLINRAKAQLSQARSYRKYSDPAALPILFHGCLVDDSIRLMKKYGYSTYSIYPRSLGVFTYMKLYLNGLVKRY
ncbi:MAG: squalene/phytoene synthase family protein [Alphaproteobacteria bacterium]|nr:squalene/phytoene synthase family protein [Alphaproteobacteria bacterium]